MTSACILGCLGPRLLPEEKTFFAQAQPWGFILFSRNIETPDQVRRLTTALRDAVGWEAPILIDQEGGRVDRMGPPHWRSWLAPLDQVTATGPASMRLRYQLIAHDLRSVGIDVNCAPMGDIADACTHHILRNRCYGTDKATVTEAARHVAEGLLAGGVLPVLKHIPGHGRSHLDTHLDLPVVGEPLEVLEATDFAPFRALGDIRLGMTCHLIFTALDPERPATQSPIVIDFIRDQIGFDGLLMTDDISMEALDGGLAARAEQARAAGCDLVLHCNGELSEMEEIAAHSGQMEPEALRRAARALEQRRRPEPIDIEAAAREFDALEAGAV